MALNIDRGGFTPNARKASPEQLATVLLVLSAGGALDFDFLVAPRRTWTWLHCIYYHLQNSWFASKLTDRTRSRDHTCMRSPRGQGRVKHAVQVRALGQRFASYLLQIKSNKQGACVRACVHVLRLRSLARLSRHVSERRPIEVMGRQPSRRQPLASGLDEQFSTVHLPCRNTE